MHIGIQRLHARVGQGAHRNGCVTCARQRQDAILCHSVQRRLALHAVDGRGKRLAARPVCRNQQPGGVAVGVARHQHVGLHLPGRRTPAGLHPDDVPAVIVQRVVYAADPAHGLRTADGPCAHGTAVVIRVDAVDVKGLKLLVAVVELHIEAGQRNIAGIPDREHNLGIVSGADAGIDGCSGRQLRRADQRVGERGERLLHIGAVAAFQIHRIVAGSVVQQPDAAGALRKLHQTEGAADRIRAGVIAHAPHQILCLDSLPGRTCRGRAFRPVQIHARTELDNIKAVRDELHVIIRDHRPRGCVCPAFEALGVFALLQLHPLQIEQPVRGRTCMRLFIYAEIDDILLCQHLPRAGIAAHGQAGKRALRILRHACPAQGIELLRPRRRDVRDAETGDLRRVCAGQALGILQIGPGRVMVSGVIGIQQAAELLRASGCDIGAQDTIVLEQMNLRHNGIVDALIEGRPLLIALHLQAAFLCGIVGSVVAPHQHGGHAGLGRRGGIFPGAC